MSVVITPFLGLTLQYFDVACFCDCRNFVLQSKRSRSSINRTKLQTTNNYTEQLAPLYPFLSKTQVRAGVVLANNNLHKSRLLLDLTNKFLTVTPLNLAMYFHQRRKEDPVIYMDKSSSTDDSFSTVTMFSSSEESWKENIPPNEGGGKGEEANSNVFEFTDSETKILSWSSHKRLCAKKKKVGVSIIKCQQGYKAFLL
ncbi:hypothetical protein NQ315_008632 [Exocentrus adspersus]|uniref:Uncharacterized protein n=1 Tax=Exocentrus adspersus TaxID=1586481 RepID=A0AAV8W6D2_9CUCU|nr:hypothetical protein NQ315_008632 [Exocentrus adspersus]